ncbi:MAG: hypothetical protein OXF88_23885 [Rhodobacteraceae bacterium]|nr:hypothetical protein [Paracoccaceae bacterium]MCY4140787.1 hypothetical protein [Paracoccaceae bacterium]
MAIESQPRDGSTDKTVDNDGNVDGREPISAEQHAVAEAVARQLFNPVRKNQNDNSDNV